MTAMWRCRVCEGVNAATTACATCGAPITMATSGDVSVLPPPRPVTVAASSGGPATSRPPRLIDRATDAVRRAPGALVAARDARLKRLARAGTDTTDRDVDEERPRLRVLPLPGGCLFSIGPTTTSYDALCGYL
jgi:hypothetical protein